MIGALKWLYLKFRGRKADARFMMCPVEVELADGTIVFGEARVPMNQTRDSDATVFVITKVPIHPWPATPSWPNTQGDFNIWTGKYLVWGQGRHGYDNFPRLNMASCIEILRYMGMVKQL